MTILKCKMKEFSKSDPNNYGVPVPPISLGNCEAATPVPTPVWADWHVDIQQEKGNNPMRIDNTSATYVTAPYLLSRLDHLGSWRGAKLVDIQQEKGNNPMRIDNTSATYVTAPKSDDAISREYLLSRLDHLGSWRGAKLDELSDFFNLSENGRPKTYQQLIDAIKNDKFSLDEKKIGRLKLISEDCGDGDIGDYGYGPFYAMIFTDLPKADHDGYNKAVKEFNKLIQATKDIIMVSSPAEGLKALQALEAWLPAGKAN